MSRGGHIETLINEVAKRRILWDMRDKNYHNRYAVDEEWSQVAKVLDMRSNEAKAKWKSLRDSFRRELKKIPNRDSEDNPKLWYSKWAYFDSMLFLRDVMKFKEDPKTPRCSDAEETHTNDSDYKDRSLNGEDDSEKRLEHESQHSEINLKSSNHSNIDYICKRNSNDQHFSLRYASSPKKKRRHDRIDLLERILLELETKRRDHLLDDDDDDLNFFKSLLPYIRKLPPLKKLQLRSQYQGILINEIHKMETKTKTMSEAFSNFTYPSSSTSTAYSSTTVSATNSDFEDHDNIDPQFEQVMNLKSQLNNTMPISVDEIKMEINSPEV